MLKTLMLCLLQLAAVAQWHSFTLTTYNSLRYSPNNIDARHPHFRTVMNHVKPDILVLEELSGLPSAQMFLDSVLNIDSNTYSLAGFVDANDLDIALFYKNQKFSALSTKSYPTSLRDIFHYRLIPAGLNDTLHLFGVHLKASSGSTNESRRKSEVDVLRSVTNSFRPGTSFIVCGDFNIYSGNEPAYQALVENLSGDEGHFIDPFNMPGNWNSSSYAQYHTQSPRTTQFNGGAHGGMDDRFDLILFSEALDDSLGMFYQSGTMKAIGNDGQHYNKAVIDMPLNSSVSAAVATALHQASDHLPVSAQFSYHVSGVGQQEYNSYNVSLYKSVDQWYVQNPDGRALEVRIFGFDGRMLFQEGFSSDLPLPEFNRAVIVLISDAQSGQAIMTHKVFN